MGDGLELVNSTHAHIEFYNTIDGRRLAAHVWRCERALANVVFLHGISSHAGWYARGCEYLSSGGFAVHFLDRRGSGANREARGDVDCWKTWIEDVSVYLEQLRKESPLPTFLCGISWGGKQAVAVACEHASLVDGLALICPGLFSPFEPGLLKRVVLRSPLASVLRGRYVAIPLRDPALFTGSREWQEFIANDEPTLREITVRFAREDRLLTEQARSGTERLRMPLLLVLAGRDRIIDNARVHNWFARASSSNKTVIEYPTATHTLEFEVDPQPYFNDLAGWLGQIASSLGAR